MRYLNTPEKTSRYLSYILRHRPYEIHLAVDEHGWADNEELIANAETYGDEMSDEWQYPGEKHFYPRRGEDEKF